MKTAIVDKNAVGRTSTHPTELIQKIQKGLRFSELKTLQDTLDLPFEKDCFDAVFLQHVAMNIADRANLYAEIQRVLKPGGRFATYDILRAAGEPHYPLPWARTPETSFLLTEGETRDAVEAAGFHTLAWHDDTDTAKAWFAQAFAAGPPPAPNLGIVMGPEFPGLTGNLVRSLMEDRVRVFAAVFDTP